MSCRCVDHWQPQAGRVGEYRRAKHIFNQGRHPTFLGPQQVNGMLALGGVWFAQLDGQDIAVAIVHPRRSVLIALNVMPAHRSHGLGARFLHYLAPNWARVIESKTAWFERQGFKSLGDPKQGRSLRTQIMVREDLIGLAGRLDARLSTSGQC
jgi:GNAT superfamily N-acetyltransferase